MTMNQQYLRPGEEEALTGLLRGMAPEAEPAPEVRERIRLAVVAEWREVVAASRPAATARRSTSAQPIPARATRLAQRWQRPSMALAAGLAATAVAIGIFQASSPTAPQLVATLTRVSGPVEAAADAGVDSGWGPINSGQSLTVGQRLVTGPHGKAALTLTHGATLRLDVNTRIALAGIDRLVVERGAVYLDAGDHPTAGQSLQIDTTFGSTRHLGTQYEVRVTPVEMLVSVREGRVELSNAARALTPVVAQAGEQLVIGSTRDVARRTVDRRDPRWHWIADVTPPYAIEDRRLAEFLTWVCRETGRELAFDSPDVEAAAQSIILRGSVAGLSPDEALAAVMATTNLTYSEVNGRLIVRGAVRQAAAMP